MRVGASTPSVQAPPRGSSVRRESTLSGPVDDPPEGSGRLACACLGTSPPREARKESGRAQPGQGHEPLLPPSPPLPTPHLHLHLPTRTPQRHRNGLQVRGGLQATCPKDQGLATCPRVGRVAESRQPPPWKEEGPEASAPAAVESRAGEREVRARAHPHRTRPRPREREEQACGPAKVPGARRVCPVGECVPPMKQDRPGEEKVPGKRWPLPALGPRCGPRTTGHGRGQRAEEGLAGGRARSGRGSSRVQGRWVGGWVSWAPAS